MSPRDHRDGSATERFPRRCSSGSAQLQTRRSVQHGDLCVGRLTCETARDGGDSAERSGPHGSTWLANVSAPELKRKDAGHVLDSSLGSHYQVHLLPGSMAGVLMQVRYCCHLLCVCLCSPWRSKQSTCFIMPVLRSFSRLSGGYGRCTSDVNWSASARVGLTQQEHPASILSDIDWRHLHLACKELA
jgi:hypothetical protein